MEGHHVQPGRSANRQFTALHAVSSRRRRAGGTPVAVRPASEGDNMQMRSVPMWIGNRRPLLAAGLILSAGLSAGLVTGLFSGRPTALPTGATAGAAGQAIPSDRRLPKNVVAY